MIMWFIDLIFIILKTLLEAAPNLLTDSVVNLLQKLKEQLNTQ